MIIIQETGFVHVKMMRQIRLAKRRNRKRGNSRLRRTTRAGYFWRRSPADH
jgi:hypothetical protein